MKHWVTPSHVQSAKRALPFGSYYFPRPRFHILVSLYVTSVLTSFAYFLDHWLSTSLMLFPFNTVPHVVVTPNHKIFLLLHHNCTFAIVRNHSTSTCGFWWSWATPVSGPFDLQRGCDPQIEICCFRPWHISLTHSYGSLSWQTILLYSHIHFTCQTSGVFWLRGSTLL